jgi:hypothetical protein
MSTAPKSFIFVLMPFKSSFNDIYKYGIKGAAEDAGAYSERIDEQDYTESTLDRIYNQINKADVIVADMTGQNSNVFYEVGYAHALDKIVILLTQDANDIPFDLRHRPHIIYGGQIETLRNLLTQKLKWAINESGTRKKVIRSPEELLANLVSNSELYFHLVNQRSGKSLDVADWRTNDGNKIQQWLYHAGYNQIWGIHRADDGYFFIISKHSRKCLTVADGSHDNGAEIIQWEYRGHSHQQWQLAKVGDGSYRIIARHSGKCLDVDSASCENGAAMIQSALSGDDSQRWWLNVNITL